MKTWRDVIVEAIRLANIAGFRVIPDSERIIIYDLQGVIIDQYRINRNDLTLEDSHFDLRLDRLRAAVHSQQNKEKL